MPTRPAQYESRGCVGCGLEFVPSHGNQRYCGAACHPRYARGATKACKRCTALFSTSHANSLYCSEECRAAAWAYVAAEARVQVCEVCGAVVEDARTRRWCSGCAVEGKRREQLARMRAKSAPRSCTDCGVEFWRPGKYSGRGARCDDCAAVWVPRVYPVCRLSQRPKPRLFIAGFCRACGVAVVAAPYGGSGAFEPLRVRYCSRECSERANRRAARSRRRARLKGARVDENVSPQRVFERDGWICRICRKPVKREAQVPHPKAPTLDHIVALALGGAHSYENAQCAHFICNARKSDQIVQTPLFVAA